MYKLKLFFIALGLLMTLRTYAAFIIKDGDTGISYLTLTDPANGKPGTCEVTDNKSYNKSPKVVIRESLTDGTFIVIGVGDYAFGDNASNSANQTIESVDFSNCTQLQSIGTCAFQMCQSLTSIDLSGCTYLKSIEKYAFSSTNKMSSVFIPDIESWWNVKLGDYRANPMNNGVDLYIKDKSGTQKVTEVTVPANLTDLGWHLTGCKSLKKLNFTTPETITTIEEYAFFNCSGLNSNALDLSKCTQLQSIGVQAFGHCTSLNTLDLSKCTQLQSIGNSAFYQCTSLNTLDLSRCTQLQSIGSSAFYQAPLTSVTLPESLNEIGYQAFAGCSSLTEVYCYAKVPPTFKPSTLESSNYLFSSPMTESGTLYVPAGSVEAYEADDYWGKAFRILPIDANPEGVSITTVSMEGNQGQSQYKRGEEFYLTAEVEPADATFSSISWSVDPAGAVTFTLTESDDKGVEVTATVAAGTTTEAITITAQVDDTDIKGTFSITVSGDVLPGDANDNGSVTLADVITIANEILVQDTEQPSTNKSFCFVNADVNVNKEIDLQDQAATSNIAMGLPPFPEETYAKVSSRSSDEETVLLKVDDFVEGANEIGVRLTDASGYISLQADFLIPEEFIVIDVVADKGVTNHTVAYNLSSDNRLRVLVYSLDNSSFQNNGSPLFLIKAEAGKSASDLGLGMIKLVDNNIKTRSADVMGGKKATTAGIESSITNEDEDIADVYDLYGRIVARQIRYNNAANAASLMLPPGVYIIRGQKSVQKIILN